MKTRHFFLLLAIPLLGRFGFAQMTASYSSYATFTADATHIYATAVVDGSATCNNIHIQSLNCSAIYHQGRPYLEIGNTGGTVYGAQVCPTCYISVSNPQSIPYTVGASYTATAEGAVFCSGIGALIFETGTSYSVGASETLYALATKTCSWNKSCPVGQTARCGVGTIYGTPPCSNFVELYYVWYNFGAGNVCVQYGPGIGSSIPVGGCD